MTKLVSAMAFVIIRLHFWIGLHVFVLYQHEIYEVLEKDDETNGSEHSCPYCF